MANNIISPDADDVIFVSVPIMFSRRHVESNRWPVTLEAMLGEVREAIIAAVEAELTGKDWDVAKARAEALDV